MSTTPAAVFAGASEAALNLTAAKSHAATYPGSPGPFQGTAAVGSLGFKEVSWSIPAAPTLSLTPKSQDRQWLKEQILESLGDVEFAEAWATAVSEESVIISVEAKGVEITLTPDTGPELKISGDLTALVQARTHVDRKLVFKAQHSRFQLTKQSKDLQKVVDHIVVPQVQAQFNKLVSAGYLFDPFMNTEIVLSAPYIAVVGGALVAFAAEGPTSVPALPPALPYPKDRVQGLVLVATWDRAFKAIIRKQNLFTVFGPVRVPLPLGFSAELVVKYGIADANLLGLKSANRVLVRAIVCGGGRVAIHIPIAGTLSLGLGISAKPVLEYSIATGGGQIAPKLETIDAFDVSVDLPIPTIIKPIVDALLNFIASALKGPIVTLIKSKTGQVPPIPVSSLPIGWGNGLATLTGTSIEVVQTSTALGVTAVPVATRIKQAAGDESSGRGTE